MSSLFTGKYIGNQEDLKNFEQDLKTHYSNLVSECRILLQTNRTKWNPDNRYLIIKDKLESFEEEIKPHERELNVLESKLNNLHKKSYFEYLLEETIIGLCFINISSIRRLYEFLIKTYEYMNEQQKNKLKKETVTQLVNILIIEETINNKLNVIINMKN